MPPPGWVAAYLARIGLPAEPSPPDAATLRRLHGAHLDAVPFENLSIHLDEPISLDLDSLFAKIVERRRGGFCYELNGLFAALLEEHGYGVRRLAGRVWTGSGYTLPFDHLALVAASPEPAEVAGGPWLVDVGFGAHSRHPLALDEGGAQADPAGAFSVTRSAHCDIDVAKGGVPQYRLEDRSRDLDDFVGMCWWQQTSPRSHFTRSLVCSRTDGLGRVSLSGDRLIRTDANGHRHEQALPDEAAIRATYRTVFGIDLDRLPRRPVPG